MIHIIIFKLFDQYTQVETWIPEEVFKDVLEEQHKVGIVTYGSHEQFTVRSNHHLSKCIECLVDCKKAVVFVVLKFLKYVFSAYEKWRCCVKSHTDRSSWPWHCEFGQTTCNPFPNKGIKCKCVYFMFSKFPNKLFIKSFLFCLGVR